VAIVANHMSRNLLTVGADDRLREAARRMDERGVGAVLVLEEERLIGILTERDLMKAVARGFSEEAKVGEWMTRHPETIESSDATDHAASLMIHGGFRHLPVLQEDRVAGIISIRDLMRVALEDSAPRGV
jgi:CBS domain-containing protein